MAMTTDSDYLDAMGRNFASLADFVQYLEKDYDIGSKPGEFNILGAVNNLPSKKDFTDSITAVFDEIDSTGDLYLLTTTVDDERVDDSPSEIIELREQLRQVQAERNKAKKRNQNQEAYHVGLGKIKELIINNPGIDRHEIVNYVMEDPIIFVDNYLKSLESSKFINRNSEWYPPEKLGTKK